MKTTTFDVIIVGGGLAGLTNAIHLSQFKQRVLLIEKKSYPKQKIKVSLKNQKKYQKKLKILKSHKKKYRKKLIQS